MNRMAFDGLDSSEGDWRFVRFAFFLCGWVMMVCGWFYPCVSFCFASLEERRSEMYQKPNRPFLDDTERVVFV